MRNRSHLPVFLSFVGAITMISGMWLMTLDKTLIGATLSILAGPMLGYGFWTLPYENE